MYPWIMNEFDAVKMLAAIAHNGRLTLFKRLVAMGNVGELSGDLGRFAKIQPTTTSARLLVLTNAGLIYSQREGRQIRYFAKYSNVSQLLNFLISDCCGNEFEICCPGCGVSTL